MIHFLINFSIIYLLIGLFIAIWAMSHIWNAGYGGRTWAIKLTEVTYITLIWPIPITLATYQFIKDRVR